MGLDSGAQAVSLLILAPSEAMLCASDNRSRSGPVTVAERTRCSSFNALGRHLSTRSTSRRVDMARARQVGTRIRGVADLRPDPLFRRRSGGSKLPIRISGPRETPKLWPRREARSRSCDPDPPVIADYFDARARCRIQLVMVSRYPDANTGQ